MKDFGETSCLILSLNVNSRGRSQDRNSNRGISKSKHRSKSKSKPGQQATCRNYNKTGQIKKNCKNPKKTENFSANVVTEEVQRALLLTIYNFIDDWILDSEASCFASSNRELMEKYVADAFVKVYVADRTTLNVVRMGDVEIILPNKNKGILQKIKHIPESKKNLISVRQLNEGGHSVVFSNNT
ncbi:uncharacterized protein LOC110024066 [Phalaenopsis equestris]|uniref:uncharacterized protein LOC110024066 n=1 Tax=Phalaenopsis equestris TaxID=78828 RepID=UPI0009E5BCFA|nr:uncharacterized protein LOC110024066 [Phalaenopsis equestris]